MYFVKSHPGPVGGGTVHFGWQMLKAEAAAPAAVIIGNSAWREGGTLARFILFYFTVRVI